MEEEGSFFEKRHNYPTPAVSNLDSGRPQLALLKVKYARDRCEYGWQIGRM